MDKSKLIELILNMGKLADDPAAFENEASVAAAKIRELMTKHSLDWADVHAAQANEQEREYEKAFAHATAEYLYRGIQKWHWQLARIIARITHTKHFAAGNYMKFFGVSANAETAAALYAQWRANIDELAKKELFRYRMWLQKHYYHGENKKNFYTRLPPELRTKYYRISWIDGCLKGILQKVIENESKDQKALVLYKEEIDNQFRSHHPKVSLITPKDSKGFSVRGYEDGFSVGSKMDITAKPLKKGSG